MTKTKVLMTKAEAKEAGANLLTKMTTQGWKVRVWENLGWLYSLYNGNLQVIEGKDKSGAPVYFAGMGDDTQFLSWHVWKKGHYPAGTPTFWSVSGAFSDPNEAVKQQVARARQFVDQLTLVVLDAEGVLANEKKHSTRHSFVEHWNNSKYCQACGFKKADAIHDLQDVL